ncbi:flavin reductase family protein [Hyphococcus formosus]|uniref:flavin reductase family protein n=1 Tax=Hyphococcus formosus TaxID=3143534 RepID=UPI00398A6560
MSEQIVSPDDWRSVMGYFASGVTVVTGWDGTEPVGTTVSAFCSVSLTPPLLLVCLDHNNPALAPIKKKGRFGVNILSADGMDVAMRFATPMETNRFEGFDFVHTDGGAPRLSGAPVFIDCDLHDTYSVGDHDILIGRGRKVEKELTAKPMIYHQGKFL